MSVSKYRHIFRLSRYNFTERLQRNQILAQTMRCSSSGLAEGKEQSVSGYGQEKKPLTNVPLGKDLFLGRFDPVSFQKPY